MPAIPERDPIGDLFTGFVVQSHDAQALATSLTPDITPLARGELVVRYGVQYLGKPHLAIVPGLIALDYGDMLTGAAAWEFLLNRSNLHPRADVIGYRNDGADDMIPIKWLDLAQPIEVLVYADATATRPLAHPTALIAPAAVEVAPRLREYLPVFETLADWQAHE